jgi:hypothetical protein
VKGDWKKSIMALRIISFAMIVGLVVFSGLSILVNQFSGPFLKGDILNQRQLFLGVALGLGLAGITAARILFNKALTKIKDSGKILEDKLNQYRQALILYMALCEMPGIISIIIFFLTGHHLLFIIVGMMIVTMMEKMPTVNRITNDLGLDWQEEQQIE